MKPMVVKLSDVGLARTLKASDYYRKSSDDKVGAWRESLYFIVFKYLFCVGCRYRYDGWLRRAFLSADTAARRMCGRLGCCAGRSTALG